MIRLPSLAEVLWLQARIIETSGGAPGLRDLGGLQSALAQPLTSFGGQDLYATDLEKCAAVTFSLVNNHPFVDGNKRIAHAVLETTLNLNGIAINALVEEQEQLMFGLASGAVDREELLEWPVEHCQALDESD